MAAIAGWAPARIELVNFLIAGFLSALAAILLAPIVTLNAAILSVTVLSALAAALVGRFSSFGATVGAALVIGVLQSELTLFQPDIAKRVARQRPVADGAAPGRATADHPGGRRGVGPRPPGPRGDERPTAAARQRPRRPGAAGARDRRRRRPGLLRAELLGRPDDHVRHRHHHRVGRRRVRLRRPAVAVPIRAGRLRGVGRSSIRQQPRRTVPGRPR